jgi:hypothetical protein
LLELKKRDSNHLPAHWNWKKKDSNHYPAR